MADGSCCERNDENVPTISSPSLASIHSQKESKYPFVSNAITESKDATEDSHGDVHATDATHPALEEGWAWVVAFVGATIHILTRGILFSTGVLFSEWISFFGQSKADTAWIGSIATGSALLLGPVTSRFVEKWGYRRVGMMGGMICTLGFVASFWATGIYYLYISYGLVAGAGLGMCYLCGVIAVGEYFDERRSLAFGIAASGAGCGTAVMAMLQQGLLDEYGWRGTMLLLAGISGLNQIVCCGLLRPLSSSLNWRTRKSKLRLLNRRCASLEESVASSDKILHENSDVTCSQDSLLTGGTFSATTPKHESNLSKDSGFAAGEIEEGAKESKSQYMDDEYLRSKTNSGPNTPQIKAFSAILASTHSPISPCLRRKILKKATLYDRHSQGCSLNNVTTNRHLEALENDTNSFRSSHNLRDGTRSAYGMQMSRRFSKSQSHLRLRTGDALFLSSLSIASSKACAKSILGDKKAKTPNHQEMQLSNMSPSYSVETTPHRPRSYYSNVTSLHPENEFENEMDLEKKSIYAEVYYSELSSRNDLSIKLEQNDDDLYQSSKKPYPPILKNPLFLIIAMNQFFTGLGVLVPFVHLTEKSLLMGLSETSAVLLISFIGIGNVFGKILLGLMCDMQCFNIFLVFLVSQIGMALSVLLVPLLSSFAALVCFSLMFGFCYGNYSAIPSLVADYVGLQNLAQAMGYITFLEGAAAIIGPPMAGHIFDVTLNYNIAFGTAGVFLLVSCLILLLQPLFYERVTGKPSRLKIFFREAFQNMQSDEPRLGTTGQNNPEIVIIKTPDINANYD